ncbi:hypothetical protein GCM10011367_05630 [Marinicauda pacifica]|uniref:Exopolysaccharide biosynthesis protein n=1 Tax=Marinicauda pacifica TaxID=1133559 RepID=A0A4S2HDV6_9PROT|nr:exopolysaccharide biosynthesis protein [Marinicauda pacifica]TGY94235.1 exopolysaccharide biosynthesis protein [Marinicauda pacifica]GGE34053.1 hypothetical protein GCM10011367_05630 [Marinicauda pacifica]
MASDKTRAEKQDDKDDVDSDPSSLQDVLEDLTKEGDSETISVDDILEALAHRSFGPLLLIPALLSVLPVVGALPGVSYAMAGLAFFISFHFVVSKPKLWLPSPIRNMKMDRDGFEKGLEKSRPVIKWIDRMVVPRFALALRDPMPRLISILCLLVSILMLIYASVPGGIVIPAVALILLSLGLTTHDGIVIVLGILASLATIGGSVWVLTMVF